MHGLYLSLGSNLGDRYANIESALTFLNEADITVKDVSSIYETEPENCKSQPNFLNAVVKSETELAPHECLAQIQRIEALLQRKRPFPCAPRTIDIDILLYEDLILSSEELTIPHAKMHMRGFVLIPLCELNEGIVHPVFKKSMRELLEDVDSRGVVLWKRD